MAWMPGYLMEFTHLVWVPSAEKITGDTRGTVCRLPCCVFEVAHRSTLVQVCKSIMPEMGKDVKLEAAGKAPVSNRGT